MNIRMWNYVFSENIQEKHTYIHAKTKLKLTAPPALKAANILTTYLGLGSINIATTLSADVPAARNSDANDNTFSCVSRYDHTLPVTASIRHGAVGVLIAWAWNASCTIVGCWASLLFVAMFCFVCLCFFCIVIQV